MDLKARMASIIFLILLLVDMQSPEHIEQSNESEVNIPASLFQLAQSANSALSRTDSDEVSLNSSNKVNTVHQNRQKCINFSIMNYTKDKQCLHQKYHLKRFLQNKKNCERPETFYNTTNQTQSSTPSSNLVEDNIDMISKPSHGNVSTNDTETKLADGVPDIMLIKSSQTTNDMLSFEEWRKQISEQVEPKKNVEIENPKKANEEGEQQQQQPVIGTENNLKLSTNRARNFASHECGAKILAANAEASHLDKVLTEFTDEYMLNPCKSKNWLVIELCETIQPQYLEMANFELYSSIPKEFVVYASEVYPNRNEWSLLGNFTASDSREVQGFKLNRNGFVKYLKIELLSYYGLQHFCPISVVRIFGTSLFDEVERIDKPQEKIEDFDQNNAIYEESLETVTTPQNINIIGNAKDVVLTAVKKAFNFTIFNDIPLVKETHEMINASWQTKIINYYNKFEDYIAQCSSCQLIYSATSSLNIKKCQFLHAILPRPMYDVLFTQYFFSHYFNINYLSQCTTNDTLLSLKDLKISADLKADNQFAFNNFSCKLAHKLVGPNLLAINNLNGSKVIETIVSSVTATESLQNPTLEPSIILPVLQQVAKTVPLQTASLMVVKESKSSDEALNLTVSSVVPIELKTESGPNILNDLEAEGQNSFSSNSGQSKEAVIIRLTNRIKNLEKNISLMSTYLESLSVRYRNQMEEMQLVFNKTIDHLNNTAIRAAEKDTKQQELIMSLEMEITKLKIKLLNLSTAWETNIWNFTKIHIILMLIEVLLVAFVCLTIYRRVSALGLLTRQQAPPEPPAKPKIQKHSRSISMPAIPIKRELFDFIQQCENAPMFPKQEQPMAEKEIDCDNGNKENQPNGECNGSISTSAPLRSGDSMIKSSCVDNILKVIN